MATEVTATEDVKEIVQDIIAKYELNPISNITYNVGSEVGDGYMSRTVSVDIDNDGEPVHLFLKCALNIGTSSFIYDSEIFFYDIVYPAYLKFCKDRGVEDGFRNVPRCYGTSDKGIVALENMRNQGYTLFERESLMNDDHISLIFKIYAKFHAISFAYRDQKKEEYEAMIEKMLGLIDPVVWENTINVWAKMQKQMINDCLAQWDPVEDEEEISRTENLAENLDRQLRYSCALKNEYTVVTKGDCWSNNMMFLYEGENKEVPVDVKLIDFQYINTGSVVLDLSYFFYTAASKDALTKLNYYLRVYYEELANQIRQLGSDPEVLYPYSVLEQEWKVHCKYGYSVAFMIMKIMLSSKDDAPNFEEVDMANIDGQTFGTKNDEEYVRRMKILTKHMIENDFLSFNV